MEKGWIQNAESDPHFNMYCLINDSVYALLAAMMINLVLNGQESLDPWNSATSGRVAVKFFRLQPEVSGKVQQHLLLVFFSVLMGVCI
uniref:Uncharacterized protein n=1 Tax=Oryza brachyantha TaxID=4533 RepID=J3N2S7_ORYBR